ncbi:putative Heat shock 70 kDa protein 17 [Blattamonas nauphoetae]|uniref:Heat shock 70 kDa protein 17 n=1 Tax=Blattamonas nauphoetae TaxID=2049346 RepID=A0ABQ9YMK3_9EUKA|nr:putative Heat shock 70 kDa protein 17 [Blattamonas nauphoetae]
MISVATLLLGLFFLTPGVNANVIGVDFGSNFISFGLLKSGQPITVVRNENEKRITPALVTVDGKERFIGTRAVPKSGRKSFQTHHNIISLLGRSTPPPRHTYPFPYPKYSNSDRGTLMFNTSGLSDQMLPVEDLAALILTNVQTVTKTTQGVMVKDIVITVPTSYTHSQRLAILDAAKIADLNVLSLMDSTVAAAYQFGMERTRTMQHMNEKPKETKEKAKSADSSDKEQTEEETPKQADDLSSTKDVVFVDMGGTFTTFSLIHFEFPRPNITTEKKGKQKAKDLKKILDEKKGKKEEEKAQEEDDDEYEEVVEDEADEVLIDDEEDDEGDIVNESITISNQADMDRYMKKQEERNRRKQRKEEQKKKKLQPKVVKRKVKKIKKEKSESDLPFNSTKYTGRMDVLLTETDESLGGRQFDSLIMAKVVEMYHKAAAPKEYEQYGACRPYLTTKEEEAAAYATAATSHQFPTPLNPESSSAKPYPGEVCRKILDAPQILPAIHKVVQSAKEMLTISNEYHGSIDDLIAELPDYRFVITKEQMEEWCKPAFDRFTSILDRFHTRLTSNLTFPPTSHASAPIKVDLNDTVVQIVGGSMRIPKLQEFLLEKFNKPALGKLLNQDEAAALGSTMYAAMLHPQYHIRGVQLVGRVEREILVGAVYDKKASDEASQANLQKTAPFDEVSKDSKELFLSPSDTIEYVPLFGLGDRIPSKKTVCVTRSSGFTLSVRYDCCSTLPLGVDHQLFRIHVKEAEGSLSSFGNVKNFTTKVTFELGKDGVVRVVNAFCDVVSAEVKVEEVSEEEGEEKKEAEGEEVKEEPKKQEEPEVKYIKRRVNLEVKKLKAEEIAEQEKNTPAGSKQLCGCSNNDPHKLPLVTTLSAKQIKKEKSNLAQFDEYEKQKERIAEIRNKLESYIFEKKEFLDVNGEELTKLCLQEQLDNARSVLDAVSLWLEDEGSDLATDPKVDPTDAREQLNSKLNEVKDSCEMIAIKHKEQTLWPDAAKALREMVKDFKDKQDDAVVKSMMNDTEADEMEEMLDAALDWLKEKETERAETDIGEPLKVLSDDVKEKMDETQKQADEMLKSAERRTKREKYEKEKKERDEKRREERRKQLEKKKKEEAKKKKEEADDEEDEEEPEHTTPEDDQPEEIPKEGEYNEL